jgi:hypothetical protein
MLWSCGCGTVGWDCRRTPMLYIRLFHKNLITITTEEEMMQREMRRVKKLKQGGQWVGKRTRSPDDVFEDDCIATMSNIK